MHGKLDGEGIQSYGVLNACCCVVYRQSKRASSLLFGVTLSVTYETCCACSQEAPHLVIVSAVLGVVLACVIAGLATWMGTRCAIARYRAAAASTREQATDEEVLHQGGGGAGSLGLSPVQGPSLVNGCHGVHVRQLAHRTAVASPLRPCWPQEKGLAAKIVPVCINGQASMGLTSQSSTASDASAIEQLIRQRQLEPLEEEQVEIIALLSRGTFSCTYRGAESLTRIVACGLLSLYKSPAGTAAAISSRYCTLQIIKACSASSVASAW